MPQSTICVIGSSNMDMNSYVPRFPKPGETLHGTHFSTGYGGKGANQAVMTARLGARVSFVAKVGDDCEEKAAACSDDGKAVLECADKKYALKQKCDTSCEIKDKLVQCKVEAEKKPEEKK